MKDLTNGVIVHKDVNGVQYIQFKKLLEYPEIQHCFTLRHEGLNFKKYDDENSPLELSYEKISEVFNWKPSQIVKPHQTHTDRVEIVHNSEEIWNEVDGLITNQKDLILCTTEADCTGLIFYDPVCKVIGNVHSGWKGTYQEIAKTAVRELKEEFNVNPKNFPIHNLFWHKRSVEAVFH